MRKEIHERSTDVQPKAVIGSATTIAVSSNLERRWCDIHDLQSWPLSKWNLLVRFFVYAGVDRDDRPWNPMTVEAAGTPNIRLLCRRFGGLKGQCVFAVP